MPISYPEFLKKLELGNLVPISYPISLDCDTAVSTYLKFQKTPHSFLFESMEGGERWGRFSFLGMNPRLRITAQDGKWILERRSPAKKLRETGEGSPLIPLKNEMATFKFVPDPQLPRLCGGAVGYLGYDAVRYFEELPDLNRSKMDFPQSYFAIYDHVIIFDNLRHMAYAVVNAYCDGRQSPKSVYQKAIADLEEIVRQLKMPLKKNQITTPVSNKPLVWKNKMNEARYSEAVLKAKEYIKAGDIFQVVLSSRWEAEAKLDPASVYRVLRSLNPSPYLFCLKMGGPALVGSSPEVMVRLEGRTATVRPIAGTRPRGKNSQEDLNLEQEMLKDPKECSEHIMLVDLGRNDLGRVCQPGSVKVSELMTVERYSHVMHIVSNVEGILAKGQDAFDLLEATFPAGTLSGAPKIRAMEIIEELEPEQRGFYGGCVGYIDFAGNLDTAITIRSIALTQNRVFVQAGAGLVYDSIPEKEYQECQNKARAVMEAVKAVVSS